MSISSNSQLCNQLQYALFAADMAILIEDEHRKIQFVNQAYCDVLELPMKPEELIGFDFATTSIFVRHQFQSIDDFASRASQFEKEAIIQRDDKLVTKSGVVILRDYVPIIENGIQKGNVWYFKKAENIIEINTEKNADTNLAIINTTADIISTNSNQKADSILQLAENKYSRIINSLNDIVFEIDVEGNLTYLNKSWERLAESKLEDSINSNLKLFFTDNHYDQEIQFERLMMQANGEVEDTVYPFIAKSGFKWVSIDIEAVYEAEVHKGYSGIMIDVTEKILAEKQLQLNYQKEKNINEMKSKLVSMISHEFRTPLAAISSSVEIMQFLNESNKLNDNPKTNDLIHKINDQISKMGELIDGVLLINKIDSGKLQPQYIDVELIELLNDTIQDYDSTGYIFNIEADTSELHVTADRELLKKAFNNLISNAILYSKEQKIIDINIHKNCKIAEISIKDYGIGIPEDEQSNLFKSFYRGSNVRNISGVGLGLVVSKHILSLHKAVLSLTSNENIGTEVKISFELEENAREELNTKI